MTVKENPISSEVCEILSYIQRDRNTSCYYQHWIYEYVLQQASILPVIKENGGGGSLKQSKRDISTLGPKAKGFIPPLRNYCTHLCVWFNVLV